VNPLAKPGRPGRKEIRMMVQVNQPGNGWDEPRASAVLVLQDGTVLEGFGIGAVGESAGEVCFNTAMTGYEEILTDPSYAGQIITFTFPHIGNVGTNEDDIESVNAAASSGVRGVVLASAITDPSNWRATRNLDSWLKARGIVGLTGIDTRALTALIRERGMPNAVIAHDPASAFDNSAFRHVNNPLFPEGNPPAAYTEAVTAAKTSLDPAVRKEALTTATEILLEESFAMSVSWRLTLFGAVNDLRGFEYTVDDFVVLKNAWLAD
jgi:carbamoylphosphate synthase small subunit